uniref:Uncharacterized protein n=1 Tax=Ceratitis capitata TaxID=7213 RepID=W8BF72_CERCA
MFHVRRRPADSQPRRRKKKPLGASNGANSISSDREGAVLVEVTHSGDGGRRIKLGSDPIEVRSTESELNLPLLHLHISKILFIFRSALQTQILCNYLDHLFKRAIVLFHC